jgi:cell division protein FtsL
MARTTSSQRGASRTGRSTVASKRTATDAGRARRTGPKSTSGRAPKRPAARRTPSRRRSRVAGPWIPLVVVVLAVAVVWSLYPALRLQYVESRRVAGLQAEYASLRARNDALRAQVADLKTPEGVERAARENLGLARDGENVYVVIPSDGASGSTDSTRRTQAASAPGLVEALLDAVFGVRGR